MVEAVLLPTKAGFGSVLGCRTLKLDEKLQEGQLGKEIESGKGERSNEEPCCRGKWRW